MACPSVSSCCSLSVLLLALVLGGLEAFLRWEVGAAARLHPPPDLPPVPTFNESELSRERFYREFVLARRPVKIRLSDPDTWNTSSVLKKCGKKRVHLISAATHTALQTVARDPVVNFLFNWILMPLIGRWTTLEQELRSRLQVPVGEYVPYAEEPPAGAPSDFALPVPLVLRRVFPVNLLLLLDVFARPRYLHDTPLQTVCPDALEQLTVPRPLLPNWFFAASPGREFDQEINHEPTVFFGKAHTMSYPMHRNIASWFDFALVVLQGKKRYALFEADEHDKLSPFQAAESVWLYLADVFAPDLVATPGLRDARGWKGEVEAGEVLFSPGDSIHVFENYDFDRPTAAVKFWYKRHTEVEGCSRREEAECAERYGVSFPGPEEARPSIAEYKAQGLEVRKRAQTMMGMRG